MSLLEAYDYSLGLMVGASIMLVGEIGMYVITMVVAFVLVLLQYRWRTIQSDYE